MALKTSELDAQLDAVAERIRRNRAILVRSKGDVTTADTDLGSIPSASSELISTINDLATNNPDNTYYGALKDRLDALATEFQALKTTSAAMKTDLANDDPS